MENEEQSKSDQESLKISSKLKQDPLFLRDLYLDVNQRLFGKDNHLKSTLINPYKDLLEIYFIYINNIILIKSFIKYK
jgi:hypothetical protein